MRIHFIVLLGLGLIACKHKDTAPSPAASATEEAVVAPPGADAALYGQLATLTKQCTVDVQGARVTCPHGERQKLVSDLARDQQPRIAALPTLALALGDHDPKIQTVAADVLYSAYRMNLGKDVQPSAVTAETSKALLDAVGKLPAQQSHQVVPAAVHAAVLGNQLPALYALLDAPQAEPLASIGYRYLMTYGRIATFDKIKQVSGDSRNAVAMAAMESPRNMTDWAPPEQAAICPWAQGLFASEQPIIAAKAASLLSDCRGPYVDALLDSGEALVKTKKLSTAQIAPFRDLCSARGQGRKDPPTPKQCDRDRKLLERIVDSKDLDARTRSLALTAIAYQWPDDDCLKLAKKYASGTEVQLAAAAKQTAERLERRNAAPGAAGSGRPPGPPGLPGRPMLGAPRPPGAISPPGSPPPTAPAPANAPR